jgi:hypothetical protein
LLCSGATGPGQRDPPFRLPAFHRGVSAGDRRAHACAHPCAADAGAADARPESRADAGADSGAVAGADACAADPPAPDAGACAPTTIHHY